MAKENLKQKSVFDTDRQYLGDVYAKALWGLAKASGQSDALVEELDSFVDALQQLPRLAGLPGVSPNRFRGKKPADRKVARRSGQQGVSEFCQGGDGQGARRLL